MAKTAKNILTLNHEEAMDFFMKSEQYHGFELQEYDNRLKVVLAEIVRTGTWFLEQMGGNMDTVTTRWMNNKFSYGCTPPRCGCKGIVEISK